VSIDSIICLVRLSELPKGWSPPEDYRGPAKKDLFKIDPEDFQTVSDFLELKSTESAVRDISSSSASTTGGAGSSGLPKSAPRQSISAVEGNVRLVVPVSRQPGKRAATRFVK
jgi:hypothetical protein